LGRRIHATQSRFKLPGELGAEPDENLLYRLDRWLFEDVPEGYPLRTKVKIKLQVLILGLTGARSHDHAANLAL
jgi:hypothetical protein